MDIQHVQIAKYSDAEIVAACLIGEAASEGVQGMVAVMNVVSNRAHKNDFKTVVLARKQFSVFNGRSIVDVVHKSKQNPLWPAALMIVDNAKSGHLQDITAGATHYYAPKAMGGRTPSWANEMEKTMVLGNHVFLK